MAIRILTIGLSFLGTLFLILVNLTPKDSNQKLDRPRIEKMRSPAKKLKPIRKTTTQVSSNEVRDPHQSHFEL